ncbi:MAG: DUF1926 domain-containing protein [Candidatus Schekmanbacteria bacterium]|nr:MAG: DUF1926 domain-containing protein [Candidatus Schekmanbacteria bacterium]
MMKMYFALALHFHQPVGNFDYVLERAYQNSYLPFVETLKKFPSIKANLHLSGSLLEWIELRHREFFDDLSLLTNRGQVELISGGFYEPVLTAIPERDAIGQIEMLSDYLKKNFFFSPNGAWIAERVWEPYLPKILSNAKIRYTILDDTHIMRSGIAVKDIKNYYITENDGHRIFVFPTDKELRFSIPFKEIDEVISYLKKPLDEGENEYLFTYGDDVEKFGEWPGTYELVYKERWLEKFFHALEKDRGQIETVKFSDFLQIKSPQSEVYIPESSYEEMMLWSLSDDSRKLKDSIKEKIKDDNEMVKFVDAMAGGFWKNFFVKYPESNRMHKKLIYISEQVEKAGIFYGRENDDTKNKILKSLYKASCNCAYWHGLFGGIYLHHIRSAVYKNLIDAQRFLDEYSGNSSSKIEVEEEDYDFDGKNEVILSNNNLSLWINPSYRGSIVEIDWMEKGMNVLNVLTRRYEPYHSEIGNQIKKVDEIVYMGDEENFFYDKFYRTSFTHLFLEEDISYTDFISNSEKIWSLNRGIQEFDYLIKKRNKVAEVLLIGKNNNPAIPILKKRYFLEEGKNFFSFLWEIENVEDSYENKKIALEINLSLTSADSEGNRFLLFKNRNNSMEYDFKSLFVVQEISKCKIESKCDSAEISIEFSQPCSCYSYPLKTISRSERGFDFIYQGTCLIFVWSIAKLNEHKIEGSMQFLDEDSK